MADDKDELQVQIQYKLIEKLSSSQQRQAKLLEMLQECIFECDSGFELNYVNAAWSRRLGYDSSELIGKSLLDLIPDKSAIERLQKHEQATSHDELSHGNELELLNVNGERIWFELRLTPTPDRGYIGSLFDIHTHKKIEWQLRQREEEARRLSLVASHTSNLVIITGRTGTIEWVNESFETVVGFSCEEVIGRKPGHFLQGPETDAAKIALMSDAVQAGRPFQVEVVNYNRAREPYWVAIDASPVTAASGEVTHFIAIQTDITKRIEAEQKVAESEYNYRSVVDNISEVVLRLQPNGKILFANKVWEQIFGPSETESLDIEITRFISPADRPRVLEALFAYREGVRSVCQLDLQIVRHDGSKAWVEMTMTPIEGSQRGSLSSIAATLVDVDRRVAGNRMLQEAKQQAELLADEKSRFLANISHEIRTPLNAVIGSADILQETGLTLEQRRYTDMIKTSGDALLGILDDVLEFSRAEASGISVEYRHFNLAVCLEEAIDIVSEEALNKGLRLILNIHPKLPLLLSGDNMRLRQIVINLVSNAIKFTEHGEIIVRASADALIGTNFNLKLEIQDSGIGIHKNQLGKMFEPFVQSDVSTTRRYGGSGLGLAICRQICDAVGGAISVESEVDIGSTFEVTFPLTIQSLSVAEATLPYSVQSSNNFQIWVVGKPGAIREAVINLLSRHQLPHLLFDSVEYLPVAQKRIADFLLVTDVTEAVRARRYIHPYASPGQPPCLVVLNLAGKGRVVQSINSNEVHLNGPFKLSHLPRALESLEDLLVDVRLLSRDANSAPIETVRSYEGKTVLVVEDNEPNQLVATQFLKQRGCGVIVAGHGVEALKYLQVESVDLILMDIQMPVMDGLTTTHHIRSSKDKYSEVPIIAVTADALHGDRERYLGAGMDGYLAKPLTRQALYKCLDAYLLPTQDESVVRSKFERLRAAKEQLQSLPTEAVN